MVQRMEDVYGKLQQVFAEGLYESGENFRKTEKNTATEGGMKYALRSFEKDGRRFVEIDQDQDRFEGYTIDEYPRIAKEIIKEKFEGKVVGIDNKMFVNGAGRNEYAYPSKPITDDDLYAAKMRASPELDNLLDAGTNFRNEPDGRDGHVHPDVIGGFDYFDTLFKIGDRYFEGKVNIKNVKRGKLFTDVTKIKDVTQAIMSSYGANPKSQFLRTSSMNSIRNSSEVVKENHSEDSDSVKFAIRRKVQPTVESMLRKENAELKEDVARLKDLLKLQRTVTDGTLFTKSSVADAAAYLKKYAGATGSTQELTELLETFYGYIAKGQELSWDEVREKALPAARWLQEHVKLHGYCFATISAMNHLRFSL